MRSWQSWPMNLVSAPKLVQTLVNGNTNNSYLIEAFCAEKGSARATSKRFCLRLHAENSRILGISRTHEHAILDVLAPLNIAPRLVHFNRQLNFSVFPFIEGRCWSPKDFIRLGQRERLSNCLELVRKQKIDLPRFNYMQHLKRYLVEIEKKGDVNSKVKTDIVAFLPELQHFMEEPWRPVLCHHDLIPENILDTDDGIVILDWEYAGLGHPEFDTRYVQHCINSQYKDYPDYFLKGDTLDKLIYWLVELWHVLNKPQEG